jgi:predicted MFS family arabinose efflux permease
MTTQAMPKIWTRDFRLIFLIQFAFSSAYCLLIPTLPIYLSKIGSTEVEIGVLMGMLGMSSLVVRPLVGRALLKISEEKFMSAGALLFALGTAGYLLAAPFWLLLILRIVQGMGAAALFTATVISVVDRSPETRLGQSLSYYYLAFNIAFALTPSLGMFLANAAGFPPLFMVCTGLTLGSLLIIAQLGKRRADPSAKADVRRAPLLSRQALPMAVMAMISGMIWGSLTAFFPLYAFNQGVSNPGLFFTAFATMIILGRALGGRILDLHSREKVILPCLTASVIAMGLLPFSRSLPMFIVAAMVWGIGHAFFYPALAAYTLDCAGSPPGLAMGTFSAFDELGSGLGPVLSGILLRLSSYPVMFLFLALTGLFNLVYFNFLVRKRQRTAREMPVFFT